MTETPNEDFNEPNENDDDNVGQQREPTDGPDVAAGGTDLDDPRLDSPQAQPAADAGGQRLDLLDVPLDVTVELGRTRLPIADVLQLASGSVIELEKMAGEPLDVLLNGRLVARGEAVVVGERFGIRITTIVSPRERLARLH